jgi:hypothetical protein
MNVRFLVLKIAILKNHTVSLQKKVQGFQKCKFDWKKLKNDADMMPERGGRKDWRWH